MGGAILYSGVVGTGGNNGFFWALLGNAGTVDGVNFIGTTDNIPLSFRVSGVKSGRIDHIKHSVYFGYQSGMLVPTGVRNAVYGDAAGAAMTLANECCFFGSNCGVLILDAGNCCAFGHGALRTSVSDARNSAFGDSSLANLTGGAGNASDNSAFGYGSGNSITTGKYLSLFGSDADVTAGTEIGSIALGCNAQIAASNECVIGGSGAQNSFITQHRNVYTTGGAQHQTFFRTTTAEGNQVGVRGDIAHVNDGATGWVEVKTTGTGNTGWLTLAPSAQFLPLAGGTMTGTLETTVRIALKLSPFGAGAGNTGEIRFLELAANGVHYSAFKAADAIAANVTWVVPIADATIAGQCIKSDAAGNLSFGNAPYVATIDLVTQGAAIAATTGYAVPAAGAGMYRVTWVATVTRVATTSCTLGGATGFQLQYTDADDSVVKLSNPTTLTVSSINATGTSISGTFNCYCKASTNLQYLMGYTSSGVQSMQFNLHVKIEAL